MQSASSVSSATGSDGRGSATVDGRGSCDQGSQLPSSLGGLVQSIMSVEFAGRVIGLRSHTDDRRKPQDCANFVARRVHRTCWAMPRHVDNINEIGDTSQFSSFDGTDGYLYSPLLTLLHLEQFEASLLSEPLPGIVQDGAAALS